MRGICGLKPGQPGLSENIKVRSILGRYLEHARIFSFHYNGDPQVFIGSADMLHRNLDRRVEALVRLTSPDHLRELDDLFDLAMSDDTSSWWLEPDGTWTRLKQPRAGRRSPSGHTECTHEADLPEEARRSAAVSATE